MLDEYIIIIRALIVAIIGIIVVLLVLEYHSSVSEWFHRRKERKEKNKKKDEDSYRYTEELSTSTTIFACDRPPIKLIELIEGDGLFPKGIKALWEVPSIEKQVKLARNLDYVKSVNSNLTQAEINLGRYGRYIVDILRSPEARRLGSIYQYSNPFIKKENYKLCMGSSGGLYNQCYLNNNKRECLKIIQEVLKCDDDSDSYRKWYQCR